MGKKRRENVGIKVLEILACFKCGLSFTFSWTRRPGNYKLQGLGTFPALSARPDQKLTTVSQFSSHCPLPGKHPFPLRNQSDTSKPYHALHLG